MSRIALTCDRTMARDYVARVATALRNLPRDLDRILGERGVEIFVDRRWTDIWEDWDPTEERPNGDGYTSWAECGAFYRPESRRVYMVEEINWKGEWTSDAGHVLQTLCHELGHALDYTSVPRPSQDSAFREVYLRERERAKGVEALRYYTWHWAAGVVEAFATAFAAGCAPLFEEEDEAFRARFAGCIEWVTEWWNRQ